MPVEYTPVQIERFWSYVIRGDDDACWPWNGARNSSGYGHMKIGRRMVKAHRIAWEIANNEPLGDRRGRHSCDNPTCCNPAHIAPGTQIDNIADMDRRARRGKRTLTAAEYQARRTCPQCGGAKSDHAAMCRSCKSAILADSPNYRCPVCGGWKGCNSFRCMACRRARRR